MLNKKTILCFLCFLMICSAFPVSAGIFTPIEKILQNPDSFRDSFVSVIGDYYGWRKAPGYPPVTRSDWVLADNDNNAIYCTGLLPESFDPHAGTSLGKPITVLARVKIKDDRPYLEVQEIRPVNLKIEKMVSVSQILFNPIEMQGQYVGLLGVLTKGYGVKGDRMYLIADPTGAIKLGRLPKLYPTGTILHIRGIMKIDKNGLPIIDNIEIVSVRVDHLFD